MTALGSILTRRDWYRTADTGVAAAVAGVPLFAKLARRQVREIARYAELAAFVPGDVVLQSGARGDFFFVVLEGEAELREEGRARRLRPGDYFGERALLEEANHSATVVATDELHVMRLPRRIFLRLVQHSPSIAFAILKQLGRQVQRSSRPSIPRAA
jgi:CRP-like cAMP-binding protein